MPVIVRLEAAEKLTADPLPSVLVRFPDIVKGVFGKVFITEPEKLLNVRLP